MSKPIPSVFLFALRIILEIWLKPNGIRSVKVFVGIITIRIPWIHLIEALESEHCLNLTNSSSNAVT